MFDGKYNLRESKVSFVGCRDYLMLYLQRLFVSFIDRLAGLKTTVLIHFKFAMIT